MSRLPQRRKSAEEIAKLRESLGIPAQASEEEINAATTGAGALVPPQPPPPPPGTDDLSDLAPLPPPPPPPEGFGETWNSPGGVDLLAPVPEERSSGEPVDSPQEPVSAPLAPIPVLDPPETFDPHESHAFNERHVHHEPAHPPVGSSAPIPVLPVEDAPALQERSEAAGEVRSGSPLPVGKMPRVVKSLKKSEQGPIAAPHVPPKDSSLPVRRHSDKEMSEMKRRGGLSQIGTPPPVNPLAMVASPFLFIPGYLAAIAGGSCFLYFGWEIAWTASCVLIALLIAGFIFLKKPLSRHHAAFITVLALFVIVFGMLHYFPALSFKNYDGA